MALASTVNLGFRLGARTQTGKPRPEPTLNFLEGMNEEFNLALAPGGVFEIGRLADEKVVDRAAEIRSCFPSIAYPRFIGAWVGSPSTKFIIQAMILVPRTCRHIYGVCSRLRTQPYIIDILALGPLHCLGSGDEAMLAWPGGCISLHVHSKQWCYTRLIFVARLDSTTFGGLMFGWTARMGKSAVKVTNTRLYISKDPIRYVMGHLR